MEGTYICTFLYIGKFEECTAIPEDDNVSGIRICAKNTDCCGAGMR